jgi:hypothetical protein
MRSYIRQYHGMRALHLLSAFTLSLGVIACSDDPIADDGDAGDTETGDGDGDGDAGPPETIVIDLFNQTCGPTATWTSATVGLMPISIPCDMVGLDANGWTVRFVELDIADMHLDKVISLVTGLPSGQQIRGAYNLADAGDLDTLEFRTDVLLVCDDSDGECVGRFALASADGPEGALSEIESRELSSGMQSIALAVPLSELQSLADPNIVLIAERTEPGSDASPQVLLIKPRLVLR